MDWNEFLGTKKRTAITNYSEGKVCSRCKRPITNNNFSGLCQYCKSKGRERKHLGESKEHLRLKDKASFFLESLGCSQVRKEHSMNTKQGRFICDVTGEKEGELYIVECGGTQRRKLQKVSFASKHIYVWPHGHAEPYLWDNSIKFCTFCGNRLNGIHHP
jgi:hypothetical protein